MGFQTRSDTNRAVQPQRMTRGLKFGMYRDGIIRGVDHLGSCCAAGLRLFSYRHKADFFYDVTHWNSVNI